MRVASASGALKLKEVAIDVANDASSFNASANSPRVLSAAPASPIRAVIAASV